MERGLRRQGLGRIQIANLLKDLRAASEERARRAKTPDEFITESKNGRQLWGREWELRTGQHSPDAQADLERE